jgi:hypothetical protein
MAPHRWQTTRRSSRQVVTHWLWLLRVPAGADAVGVLPALERAVGGGEPDAWLEALGGGVQFGDRERSRHRGEGRFEGLLVSSVSTFLRHLARPCVSA